MVTTLATGIRMEIKISMEVVVIIKMRAITTTLTQTQDLIQVEEAIRVKIIIRVTMEAIVEETLITIISQILKKAIRVQNGIMRDGLKTVNIVITITTETIPLTIALVAIVNTTPTPILSLTQGQLGTQGIIDTISIGSSFTAKMR